MNKHHFGSCTKRITKAAEKAISRIAEKHDCEFYSVDMPDGFRRWFATRSYGEPFNGQVERAVYADIEAAGIKLLP